VAGIHIPQEAGTLLDYRTLAGKVESSGFDRIWVGEVNDLDAVTTATLAVVGTEHVSIGVFFNAFTRAPSTLAMTASTLAQLAPGRVEVVLGVGSPLFVESWNGIPYRRLHARLKDVLRFLKLALAGETVCGRFETIETSDFALGSRPELPPALLLAATGPRAVALAAREADGVLLSWISPEDLGRIEELPPDRRAVSLVVPICPTGNHEVMDRRMRPIVSTYLHVPAYAEQSRRLGRAGVLEQMWAAWDAGDRAGARAALPSAVLDELVVWGTPEACRSRLEEIERETGARVIATVFPPAGTTFAEVAPL
jgi:probable F420-dependent oxidoreductase